MSRKSDGVQRRDSIGDVVSDLHTSTRASVSHISAHKPEVQLCARAERKTAFALLSKIFKLMTDGQQLELTIGQELLAESLEAESGTTDQSPLTVPSGSHLIFARPLKIPKNAGTNAGIEWEGSRLETNETMAVSSAAIIDNLASGGLLRVIQAQAATNQTI